ncbi:FKBP-type peptidyl-prolyl cis-trans isomerase [Psychroflexus tropicus]|uniref:FKBP-type peptidyl-prolyl cis-trans isomerase n=1 Tax=Psychroflexus tropicus TaxID=197345 RepID=UPI0003778836|nr:hypothetical protein [Psychroflexus tropicus]
MKLQNIALIFALLLIISCSNDDDGPGEIVTRDVEEVKDENAAQIQSFLETHFYRFEDNPENPNFQKIVFDTIAEPNQDEEPIIDSEFLESKTVTQRGVDYNLYYLKFREGAESSRKPTFADSVLVTYNGFSLFDKDVFDGSPNPVWFDLVNNIVGFYEVMDEFRGASNFVDTNPDGTVTFEDDFGFGTVFIPSGLAYFSAPPTGSGIDAYEPIVFNIQLYKSIESDHDNDGVVSWREDIDNNRRVTDDDTDENRVPNFADTDDDGDGVSTRDEITDEDDNVIFPFPDSDADGTPDYLDPTFPE